MLFASVFFLSRRLRNRRALRLAGGGGGGGSEAGPEMPLAQHLAGRGQGGGPGMPQRRTVVVQPDMSVSLCVKDDPALQQAVQAEQAGTAASELAEGGGGSGDPGTPGGSGGRGADQAGRPFAAAEGVVTAVTDGAGASTAAAATAGRQGVAETDPVESIAYASLMQASGYRAGGLAWMAPPLHHACCRRSPTAPDQQPCLCSDPCPVHSAYAKPLS